MENQTSKYSNYIIICASCGESLLNKSLNDTIVLSGTSVADVFPVCKEENVSILHVDRAKFQLAIKYTDDWHDLADYKTFSQPFDTYSFSEITDNGISDYDSIPDCDNESFQTWSTDSINSLKRNITIEYFNELKKKK